MELETIPIDRDMAHVILHAFSIASFEGMSSLNSNGKEIIDKPNGKKFANAELKVLRVINAVYPDITKQYFDVK